MKKLAYLFWTIVAVIVLAFMMTVYTAIQKRNEQKSIDPATIPTPAAIPAPGGEPVPPPPAGIPVPAEPSR